MFNFKKKYGQNFLTDKNLLKAIVSDAEVQSGDTVLEIGAGAGALTEILSQSAKKVIAYEIDRDLEPTLEGLNLPNVEFHFQDFLSENCEKIKKKQLKVVANLPYYITSPIIFKILEELEAVQSITIMVQKEVADRIVAKCGNKDYGVLSVLVSYFGDAAITRIVKRQMFTPMPNVDSALVHINIEKKYDLDYKKFSEFVKLCFSMRRKTLFNNLKGKFDAELLKEHFDDEFLKQRAESLTLDDFVLAFRKIYA